MAGQAGCDLGDSAALRESLGPVLLQCSLAALVGWPLYPGRDEVHGRAALRNYSHQKEMSGPKAASAGLQGRTGQDKAHGCAALEL